MKKDVDGYVRAMRKRPLDKLLEQFNKEAHLNGTCKHCKAPKRAEHSKYCWNCGKELLIV